MGTLITEPAPVSPQTEDWQAALNKIALQTRGLALVTLSEWDTTAEPDIQAGSIYEVAGSFFSESSDVSGTGWSASGTLYLYAVVSGSSTSWSFSSTAPTWDDEKQGWYDGTDRAFYKVVDGAKFKLNPQVQYSDTLFNRVEANTVDADTANVTDLNTDDITLSDSPTITATSLGLYDIYSEVGTRLTGMTQSNAITSLTDTDIVTFTNANQLKTYRLNRSTGVWSQVGSSFTIAGSVGTSDITALNSTDIAFFDSALESLRLYRWDEGSGTWSQVGSGLSISGAGRPSLSALNSTDISYIDETLGSLRTYRWDEGSGTWSQVGSSLSVSVTLPATAALNSTDIALIELTSKTLRTYSFNGSTWAQRGATSTLSFDSAPRITSFNSTDIAFFGAQEGLFVYRFNDGLYWQKIGVGVTDIAPGLGDAHITALDKSDIAMISNGVLSLKRFKRRVVLLE